MILDSNGRSPLHVVCCHEYLTLFLQSGADPDMTDSKGRTVLIAAIEGERFFLVRPLLMAGASATLSLCNTTAMKLLYGFCKRQHYSNASAALSALGDVLSAGASLDILQRAELTSVLFKIGRVKVKNPEAWKVMELIFFFFLLLFDFVFFSI